MGTTGSGGHSPGMGHAVDGGGSPTGWTLTVWAVLQFCAVNVSFDGVNAQPGCSSTSRTSASGAAASATVKLLGVVHSSPVKPIWSGVATMARVTCSQPSGSAVGHDAEASLWRRSQRVIVALAGSSHVSVTCPSLTAAARLAGAAGSAAGVAVSFAGALAWTAVTAIRW